ncbi:Na+/H+ antiporter subunit E [Diaphorobacter ruginosibacter]|uniref:Na+/H+ antiporter subunit E n=1 Tax=Diaphorobacter ruginosibacter TaxID=1715720 RepID=UPI00333F83FA
MMKKIFPAPLLSVALFAIWLLLNQSLSAGHILLALLLALWLPVMFSGLRPRHVRVRNIRAIARLCWAVAVDTSASNVAVVRFLVWSKSRRSPSGFVTIPLELRDPNGLAVLAMIVCITPGTAWAELSLDRSSLMLHVLEVDDPQVIIDHIKTRYERLLMEIFE